MSTIFNQIIESKTKATELENNLKYHSKRNGKYLGRAGMGVNGIVIYMDSDERVISLETLKDMVKFLTKLNKEVK